MKIHIAKTFANTKAFDFRVALSNMTWQCFFLLKHLRYVVLFTRYLTSTGTHDVNMNFIKHKLNSAKEIIEQNMYMHKIYLITIWAKFEKTRKYWNDTILWKKKYSMCLYTWHLCIITNFAIFNQHLTSHVFKKYAWNDHNMTNLQKGKSPIS